MALNATIFKFHVSLSDLNRNIYETLPITLAQHPSETTERMLARVIAFCCQFTAEIEFTKGLSTPDCPDIWVKALSGEMTHWIDVGEPAAERLKKATRLAQNVFVYSFNTKSNVWWAQEQKALANLNVTVYQLAFDTLAAIAAKLTRTTALTVTISESSLFLMVGEESYEILLITLQDKT